MPLFLVSFPNGIQTDKKPSILSNSYQVWHYAAGKSDPEILRIFDSCNQFIHNHIKKSTVTCG